MKITISTLLATCLVLIFSLSVWGQKNIYTGSLLWKVSGKDITQPSYIFGTHHLTSVDFLEKVKGFNESFDACNIVVGELDLSSKAELMQLVQKSVMIGEGEKGYKELLTKEEYAKLDTDLLTHLGVPLVAFLQMKPALISTLLAAKMYSNVNPNYNIETHKGIDEYVQILAQEQNKGIKSLESAGDQLDALFADSIEEQLSDLICSINEMELGLESIIELERLYKVGDLNGLYQLAFEDDGKSACFMGKEKKYAILDNRNKHWMKQLPQLLKDDSNFIAVGALHLAGEEGLLYQLAKMGYTIEAIRY